MLFELLISTGKIGEHSPLLVAEPIDLGPEMRIGEKPGQVFDESAKTPAVRG